MANSWLRVCFVLLQGVVIAFGQSQDVCYSIGECVQSPYVDVITAASPKDCSAHCDSLTDDEDTCRYFTHYASTGDCYAFPTCNVFSPLSCTDCVSGPRHCESASLCGLPGKCQNGTSPVVKPFISNEDLCLAQCKNDPLTCNWYSYYSSTQECYLWLTCPEITAADCTDCTYGQQACPVDVSLTPSLSNYILVMGGEDNLFETTSTTFIARLETAEQDNDYCYTDITLQFYIDNEYIYGIQEHIMVLDSNGSPVLCGGLIGDGEFDEIYPVGRNCFTPVLEDDRDEHTMRNTTYDMIHERIGAFAVRLDDGRYWIIGGSEDSAETEIFTGGSFSLGPTLPENLDRACAANIGGGRVIVSGGVSLVDESNLNTVYQYDFGTNAWTQLPSMAQARHGHSCGARATTGVLEYVVVGGVGGDYSGEFYDVINGVWSNGIPYQAELRYASSLPYQGSFLVVGGRNVEGTSYYEDIALLTSDNQWDERAYVGRGLEQTAASFISEAKVSQYGCGELFES